MQLPTPTPTIADFGGWLRDEVETKRRDDAKVVVFGTGIGASIALEACQHGPLADALILLAPVGPSLDTRLIPRLMKPPVVRTAAQRVIAGPVGRFLIGKRMAVDTEQIVRDFCSGYAGCEAFPVMFDILNASWFDGLDSVTTPAELWWGENDGVLDADHAGRFEAVLPNAEVRVLSGWGHYPMLETPAAFAAELAAACERLT